ncbi:MFS transporter [Demequina sp. NBRC 110056]|uniref:MFS transporter n=1 Tax=Demequina sp. NBRC 110056 TaxID=1570345 RepID=UPI0009FD4430|nr:MFS transporter [Demequina sp. NBRC 110056]
MSAIGAGEPGRLVGPELLPEVGGEGPRLASRDRLSRREVILVVLATFGTGMALITPLVFTLPLLVAAIDPSRTHLVGVVVGVGAAFSVLAAPLAGSLSDSSRLRWGRRRPFAVIGALIGIVSIPLMALAPNLAMLTGGWVLSSIGWGTAGASVMNLVADRAAPQQRGRVSGVSAAAMQIAAVAGVMLANTAGSNTALMVVLPALGGLLGVGAFMCVSDPTSVGAIALTWRRLFASFVFSPRQYPDFAWLWLGRFVFFSAISLTTAYTTLFYAQRLEIELTSIASIVAVTSGVGVIAAAAGAPLGGLLADKWGRKPLIGSAIAMFSAGSLVLAGAHSLEAIVVGSLINQLGLAAAGAAMQALLLDVLPNGGAEAGRYLGVAAFSQKLPQAGAPLVAAGLLSVQGGESGYGTLFVAAAVLAVLGGACMVFKVRVHA